MAPSANVAYRFNGFHVDSVRRLLFGADGKPIPLKPKVFDVLLYLVERRGELVTKQALLEAVWPHVVVEENNLNKAISTLRHVFGETRDEHRFIVTEPGRGYRFVASLEAPPATAPSPAWGPPMMPRDALGEHVTQLGAADSTPPSRATDDVPRPKRFADRQLIYLGVAVALLAMAFIAANDSLRAPPTGDVATATGTSPADQRQLEFTIHAPTDSTFDVAPAAPVPVLSPDGTQLAFLAPLKSNLVVLQSDLVVWVQTLGKPDARPLDGTAGAAGAPPFWSPDGKLIAFAAVGRLKRVAATGDGAPSDIAVFKGTYRGGTWSADGTIIFGADQGLYRVSADGGEPEPWTRIDSTRDEFAHLFPVMLPDGRRFLYLALSTQDDNSGLYLGSLDDPKLKGWLMPGYSNAALGLGSSGRFHLLFVRDSALLAQPFDAARGAVHGEPVVIAEPIDLAPSTRYAAFAVSGRALVYRPRFAPRNRLVWFDRGSNLPVGIVGAESERWRFPALSPNGTKLAALRDDESDQTGLWWLDLGTKVSQRLAPGSWLGERPGGALQSAWTPESDHVVYSWNQLGGWVIKRRSLTGIDAEPLLEGREPPGKRVRDVTEDFVLFQDQVFEPWVLPLAGDQKPYRLPIEGNTTHARLSPNGRWLAYDLTEGGGTDVYVTALTRDANGRLVIREPAERRRVSRTGGWDPQWRRDDGRELYYIAPDETLMAVSVEFGATVEIGTPTALFRASFDRISLAFGSAYAPAPDGQRFLVAEVTENNEPQLTAILNWTY